MPQLSRADLKLKLIQAISKNGRNLNTGIGIQKFIDVLVDSAVNTVDDGATIASVNADWNASSGAAQILNKPATFTPSAHTHSISAISSLQDALDQKGELGGVPAPGDTLNKLYNLIIAQFSEVQVADVPARDLYDVTHLPTNIFVVNDGDGNWALYKATTTGVGATFVKLSDPDLLNTVQTASQIKAAYESNADTNAFTNALKAFLDAVPTNTIKGRLTAGTGIIEDLTGTQITTLLDVFTTTLKGLVPASGGETTKFLRADGNFSLLETENEKLFEFTTFSLNGVNAPFTESVIGGGGAAIQSPTSELNVQGQRRIISGNASSGGTILLSTGHSCNDKEFAICKFKIPVSINPDTTIRIGLHSATTIADASNGSGYLEAIGGVCFFKTAKNSVRTTVSAGFTLVADTWYKLTVDRTSINSVTITLYSSLNVVLATTTITTNIPLLVAELYQITCTAIKSTATATVLIHVDYMGFGFEKPNAFNF